VIIRTTLFGTGGLLVLVGAWVVVIHILTGPGRYSRPVRIDAERLPSWRPNGLQIGAVLICVGAALMLVGAWAPSPN
jgi:hypothetical protein